MKKIDTEILSTVFLWNMRGNTSVGVGVCGRGLAMEKIDGESRCL